MLKNEEGCITIVGRKPKRMKINLETSEPLPQGLL